MVFGQPPNVRISSFSAHACTISVIETFYEVLIEWRDKSDDNLLLSNDGPRDDVESPSSLPASERTMIRQIRNHNAIRDHKMKLSVQYVLSLSREG